MVDVYLVFRLTITDNAMKISFDHCIHVQIYMKDIFLEVGLLT